MRGLGCGEMFWRFGVLIAIPKAFFTGISKSFVVLA